MLLRAAERDTPEPAADYLRLARETAADSLAETRQIINQLTPARLEDGLGSALRRLGQEHSVRAAHAVDVCVVDIDLPMSTQTALLRIAQGALANVARHADASRATIALSSTESAVMLTVSDDGRGFDAAKATAKPVDPHAFGLQAMQERVEQLGGRLTIESTLGSGTSVTAQLPIVRDQEASA